jgi:hypothetical protein
MRTSSIIRHPLSWRSVCHTTSLATFPTASYLTATRAPSFATTTPFHHLNVSLVVCHLTNTFAPGPSRRETGSGILSVTSKLPPTAGPCNFRNFSAVPAVRVQCHSLCPPGYTTSEHGRASSSQATLLTLPCFQSPGVPPSDSLPLLEVQNASTWVPTVGTHHPTCPRCGFAWSRAIGAASVI